MTLFVWYDPSPRMIRPLGRTEAKPLKRMTLCDPDVSGDESSVEACVFNELEGLVPMFMERPDRRANAKKRHPWRGDSKSCVVRGILVVRSGRPLRLTSIETALDPEREQFIRRGVGPTASPYEH
jgi:hypothetical protein